MKNIFPLLLFMLLFILSIGNSHAQSELFTVEGEVLFSETGDIYITLVTEQLFGTPYEGARKSLITVGEEELKAGCVRFRFMGVDAGVYGIRCYQDVNGNGELDRGLFGPSEPWGMSWQQEKPSRWPKFENIAFEVKVDIRDIKILLQNPPR
jgi:uncharacterized protein (DUF2141 family)